MSRVPVPGAWISAPQVNWLQILWNKETIYFPLWAEVLGSVRAKCCCCITNPEATCDCVHGGIVTHLPPLTPLLLLCEGCGFLGLNETGNWSCHCLSPWNTHIHFKCSYWDIDAFSFMLMVSAEAQCVKHVQEILYLEVKINSWQYFYGIVKHFDKTKI